MIQSPSYDGRGLVNLIAEIEGRISGTAAWSGLDSDLAESIPEASTYVLVLFDGLGAGQLGHPGAKSFESSLAATLEAPFPTTTTVSLATIATALPPSKHGQIAHLTWMEDVGQIVNSLKWVNLAGEPIIYDYQSLLPAPNLWERLRLAGAEPITVQPGDFFDSPLTKSTYRGARFESIWDYEELATATAQLAGEPGRLIFSYFPAVDVAGHVFGLESEEYAEAIGQAVRIWETIARELPTDVVAVGTADHGLVEFTEAQKQIVRDPRFDQLRLGGDTRGVQMWAEPRVVEEFADLTGGTIADPSELIGPEPEPTALSRLGEQVVLAPDNKAIIPKGFDKRLRCYHGGLSRAEVEIPLLVA
jgi:hypothetical protein